MEKETIKVLVINYNSPFVWYKKHIGQKISVYKETKALDNGIYYESVNSKKVTYLINENNCLTNKQLRSKKIKRLGLKNE